MSPHEPTEAAKVAAKLIVAAKQSAPVTVVDDALSELDADELRAVLRLLHPLMAHFYDGYTRYTAYADALASELESLLPGTRKDPQ